MAVAFQGAVTAVEAFRARQGADSAHPAIWADAGGKPQDLLEDTPIVARISLGADGVINAGPISSSGTKAGSSLGVTGHPMALAAELTGRSIVTWLAGLQAERGLQARGAEAGSTPGVTGTVVATTAGLVTMGAPHS